MAGDFPHLDTAVISQWPEANVIDAITRSWFPVYSLTLQVVASLMVRTLSSLVVLYEIASHPRRETVIEVRLAIWTYFTNLVSPLSGTRKSVEPNEDRLFPVWSRRCSHMHSLGILSPPQFGPISSSPD
jgi:hypothetical protein